MFWNTSKRSLNDLFIEGNSTEADALLIKGGTINFLV